jgi:tRNA/rRNA methyltransferase
MKIDSRLSRDERLKNLSVVLVRPAFAGNVGSIARVMSNFGVTRAKLVQPRCDISSVEARQFATGPSAVILATMMQENSLKEAISGFPVVIGLTRRVGKMRKPSISLEQIGSLLGAGPVGLIFGPEESGLSDQDLEMCTNILTLDVAEQNPSLNLSHAVAVTLSGVFSSLGSQSAANEALNSASIDEINQLTKRFQTLIGSLNDQGLVSSPEHFAEIITRSLKRSRPDHDELQAWHGFVTAIQRVKSN